jgi:hypothetical protein
MLSQITGPDVILEIIKMTSADPKELISYLKYFDLLSPKYIKFLYPMFVKQLEDNILKQPKYLYHGLNDIGLCGESLSSILKTTNSIMSGGFVLQAILGETWETSDIDIYCYESNVPLLLHKIGITEKEDNYHPRYQNHYPELAIYNLMNRVINDEFSRIQIIVIKDTALIEDFIKIFDFDLCRVMFDGTTIKTLAALDKIMEKKITFNPMYYAKFNYKHVERIKKYTERGFMIDFDPAKIEIPKPIEGEHEVMIKAVHLSFLKHSRIDISGDITNTILKYLKGNEIIFNYIECLPQLREPISIKILSDILQLPYKDVDQFISKIVPSDKQIILDPKTYNCESLRKFVYNLEFDGSHFTRYHGQYHKYDTLDIDDIKCEEFGASLWCRENGIEVKPTYIKRMDLKYQENEFHGAIPFMLRGYYMKFVEREEANYLILNQDFDTESLWCIWPISPPSGGKYRLTYNWDTKLESPFIVNEIKLLDLLGYKLNMKKNRNLHGYNRLHFEKIKSGVLNMTPTDIKSYLALFRGAPHYLSFEIFDKYFPIKNLQMKYLLSG